jgi:ABC-type antimicrobial peptide transport system permease subunit
MRFQDALKLGYKPLVERKGRAVLTILMVLVGVAAIIALTSQTAGISSSITAALSSLGPTTILVTPGRSSSGVHQLTQADVSEISSIPGVGNVVPVVEGAVSIEGAGQPLSTTIIGVSSGGLTILAGHLTLLSGSVYPDADVPDALVGYSISHPTSGMSPVTSVGQPMVISTSGTNPRTFTVQAGGLLASMGSTPIIPLDTSIFLPIQAAMSLLDASSYSMILVQATNTGTVSSVTQILTNIYGNNADVTSLQQIASTVSSVIGDIGLLLGAVAGISLTVAGIGIMNIMLISVYERMREIGILKALGFKNRSVLSIFLSEALIIGLVGGAAGLFAGGGASYLISFILVSYIHSSASSGTTTTTTAGVGGRFGGGGFGGSSGTSGSFSFSYSPVITPEYALLAMVIAVVVSIAAGLYPAWRAAKMDPIRALHYE